MAGPGRGGHHANGSSSPASYGRGASGTYSTTSNGSGSVPPIPHLRQPAFGQNGFPGFGAQVRGGSSGGGLAGGASPASAPQRPGTLPFRQSSHGNLHGLMNRPALQFKPSPFYRVQQTIGSIKTLEGTLDFMRGAGLPRPLL